MKFLRRTLIIILAAILAGTGALTLNGLYAQRVDPVSYNDSGDADSYQCLPLSGDNFQASSLPGYGAGRYYLKGRAAVAVLKAYARLAASHPELRFIYAEMGWKGGGRFRPHRTHQQGLSADFITPVRKPDATGKAAPATLPCNTANLWGYGIRLDNNGRYQDYRLDTAAMIAHLDALRQEAAAQGLKIERVIFDPPLLKLLRADPNFKRLGDMRFMENKAWFPHDGHYHVDFALLK